MSVSLGKQQPVTTSTVAPVSDTPKRQPWACPQLHRIDAAEAQNAPGPGADSGFVVS